jgi:acetoin utilization deacetylase AcuC-like enzyme
MGGTLECALRALEHGGAANIAGGTHHAFTDRGEGFCLLNDIAIAAQYMLDSGRLSRIAVVDLDVHQGNGTAQIFESRPEVFTLSVHCRQNYPLHKERSNLDIELELGTEDGPYLNAVSEGLEAALATQPEMVFFLCGVDILATDKLGHLAVSAEGCRIRDRMVWEACFKQGIPCVASMGGGYSPRISDILNAHAATFQEAMRLHG